MKKPYTKPMLYAETFELAEHIASICTLSGSSIQVTVRADNDDCSYTYSGIAIYRENAACKATYDEGMDGSWQNYFDTIMNSLTCYNAFSAAATPFAS